MSRFGISAAAAALMVGAAASAEELAITSSQDTTLYEVPTDPFSNGAGAYMITGETVSNGTRRALIRFGELSQIPAGSTINSVTLKLHMSRTISSTKAVRLHRATASWGEGASNAGEAAGSGTPAELNDASWYHRFYPGVFWTNLGGDYATAASASTNVGSVGNYTWSSAQLVTDVQNWVNGPGTNFGWMLLAPEDGARSAKRFDTHENPTVSFRPLLTIDYTPVPEPTSLALLVLGGLMLQRRR